MSHIGSANTGLLNGAALVFRGDKSNKNADYHSEMNTEVFLDWLKQKVFPKLKQIGKKCVVVLDRAPYHTRLTQDTRPVRMHWRKADMVDAIERWGGPPAHWPGNWRTSRNITKNLMLSWATEIAPAPKYMAQDLADQFTEGDFLIKILMLPVAHPELNPIELVWAYMKNKIAFHNFDFRITAVEAEANQVLSSVTKDLFSSFCGRSMKEEDKYREMGEVLDLTAEAAESSAVPSSCNAPANEETETESDGSLSIDVDDWGSEGE